MDAVIIHGILMSVSWMVLVPISLFIARFFKVTPKQDLTKRVDNKFWWYIHLAFNILAMVLSTLAFYIIYDAMDELVITNHTIVGYIVLILMYLQGLNGLLRGTTGSEKPHPDGKLWDHYHMTKRRLIFEFVHKNMGYFTTILSIIAVFTGIYEAQTAWSYFIIQICITLLIVILSIKYANKPRYTTYQAIFGLDKKHPGNKKSQKKGADK